MERKTEITIPLMQGVKASKVEIDYENNKVIAFYEEESKFKDGDFVSPLGNEKCVFILKTKQTWKSAYYASLFSITGLDISGNGGVCGNNEIVLATTKQKAKLLYEMNKNGYYWDAENKKVEKLEFDFEGNGVVKFVKRLGIVFNNNKQILSAVGDTYVVEVNRYEKTTPYYFDQTKVEDLKDGDLFLLENEDDQSLNMYLEKKCYYISYSNLIASGLLSMSKTVLKVMPYERD